MGASVFSSQEEHVRIYEFNAHATVPCKAEENKIKAVLVHQQVNLRMFNTDPRAPSHDLARLRSTYSFETGGNNMKTDEMWKTGQVPMDLRKLWRCQCNAD